MDPSSHASRSTGGAFPLRCTHLDLALHADFETRRLQGHVDVTVVQSGAATEFATEFVLDARGIAVASVTVGGAPLEWSVGEGSDALGQPLTIKLGDHAPAKGASVVVGIRYACAANCSAVQFLEPSQTAGKVHPYMFSQCQAIHARSLLPCQDCPAVKATYAATVLCPSALVAVMSAVRCEDDDAVALARERLGVPVSEGSAAFRFSQKVPIPSYLIAVAVGNLARRDIGARCAVWSEPEVVESAEYEFADTEKYVAAGESIAGPYVWGRYDLLILPPSFPYGGMENPTMTFVTPTLLAGDRSLVGVVAHEVAHSWTGNLVGCASWQHFWLNEGFTVYLERKILAKVAGDAGLFDFKALGGYKDLAAAVKTIGAEHNFTKLVPDLSAGEDPDDAFSRVPYEKGSYFLIHLERLVGEAVFAPFLHKWIQDNAGKSADSDMWKAAYSEAFPEASAKVDWQTWLHSPGMPPVEIAFDTARREQAMRLAEAWHTADPLGVAPAEGFAERGSGDIEGWSTDVLLAFLEELIILRSMQPLSATALGALDAAYGLTAKKNSEVRLLWYRLRISASDLSVLPLAQAFLKEQGRMKFVRPLSRALFRKGGLWAEAAVATFEAARASYHPIAVKMLEQDLGLRAATGCGDE